MLMEAAEAMVKVLEDEGVEVIFGIPGAGILPFYNALRKSSKIKHYLARHEERAPRMLPMAMLGPVERLAYALEPQVRQGQIW